jgi:hypothetical protein
LIDIVELNGVSIVNSFAFIEIRQFIRLYFDQYSGTFGALAKSDSHGSKASR